MKLSKNRQAIYDKSGGKCWYCGCVLSKGWHSDHFYPVVRVGKSMLFPDLDTPANKVPSCPQCNMMKSSMNIECFRSVVAGFIGSLNQYTTQYKFAKKYGLVIETTTDVKFWFEKQSIKMKPEYEILKISSVAMNAVWENDKSEVDYYYMNFDGFICTLRKFNSYWLAIAIDYGWTELGRIEIPIGTFSKEVATE